LNQRIKEALAMNAIDVCPLCLVFATEHDAVEMLRLNAKNPARGQNRMVNFRKATIGPGQDEVVQNIRAALAERPANSKLS
jgi:hypothetical protein